MWVFTSLDLAVLCVMLLTLGFGLGVMYWEWRTKESGDAGVNSGFSDLPGDSVPGGVRGALGLGGVGDTNPSPSGESRMGNRGAAGTIVLGANGAPSARN